MEHDTHEGEVIAAVRIAQNPWKTAKIVALFSLAGAVLATVAFSLSGTPLLQAFLLSLLAITGCLFMLFGNSYLYGRSIIRENYRSDLWA